MDRNRTFAELSPTRVLKDDPWSRVEVLCTDGGTWVRKTYTTRPWLRWRTLGARSRARRELANLQAVARAGVPALEAVAAGETRRLGCISSSWLVTRYVPDARTLKAVLSAETRPNARRALVAAYGDLLRALHGAGLLSLTAHPRNVFVTGNGGPGVTLRLGDQPLLLALGRDSIGRRIADVDLYDAAFSPSRQVDLRATERFRLLLAYFAGDRAAARSTWRRLAAWPRALHRALRRVASAWGRARALLRPGARNRSQ